MDHDQRNWANYVQFMNLLDWENNPVVVEKTEVCASVCTCCVHLYVCACFCVWQRAIDTSVVEQDVAEDVSYATLLVIHQSQCA